jgi:23S rRNA (guanine2445-N2)-methyltransferase / 23S rRNA (guanine2069-N7)-methyltransferase
MSDVITFFATAPKGLEGLLADELRELGGKDSGERRAGAVFSGTLETAYRACLWSRIANRILLPLATVPVTNAAELYAAVQGIRWTDHLGPEDTLAVDFSGRVPDIVHTHYGALKVKDAIVDQFRAQGLARPSIDTVQPTLRINVYLHRDQAVISLDLSGDSLHRRGYRESGGRAPLKENLAAAILRRAGWPAIFAAGGACVDPMCGSGTFVIEAGLMAGDIAPGLHRTYWGFSGWRGHDRDAWNRILNEAKERREAAKDRPLHIHGYDADPASIKTARENARLAGLAGRIEFSACLLRNLRRPPDASGLVVVNPPYGERLGDARVLVDLYRELGQKLLQEFSGWQAAVLTGDPELGKTLGLRARKYTTVYNGALECRLLLIDIAPEQVREPPDPVKRALQNSARIIESSGGMFENRLRKNLRAIGKWAAREGISCYRLYDADIPEYAAAVDIYGDWVHVQEYAPPRDVDPKAASGRLREMLAVLALVLECPHDRLVLKRRERQRGGTQYGKVDDAADFLTVEEQGVKLLVNLKDYLDTGLFLDHRPTRALIRETARDRRFLNLFAYTGAATIYAALGGARSTTSVDLSRTYLDWAGRNLGLNHLSPRHNELIQADCLEWIARSRGQYDLIFLDPPTFSRSKRMAENFDVQRDHVELLHKTLRLLNSGGALLFSTNRHGFKLDTEALKQIISGIQIEDITRATLPRDFQRMPPAHKCWRISRE